MVDASNSRRYRSRPGVSKFAIPVWHGAQYRLAWGVETFAGPHMKVRSGDCWYGVELATFFRTHKGVPIHGHVYVKSVEVDASRTTVPFTLTTLVREQMEMVAQVPVGAFIVRNPDGEEYAMSAEDFLLRYVPVD
jgi:hypothetical protein